MLYIESQQTLVANIGMQPLIIKLYKDYRATGQLNTEQQSMIRDYLGRVFARGEGSYENIFLTDNLTILVDGLGGISEGFVLDNEAVIREMDKREPNVGNPMSSPITGRPGLLFIDKVIDPQTNELLSSLVLVGDLLNSTKAIFMDDASSPNSISTFLLDRAGNVMVSPNPEHILKLNFADTEGIRNFHSEIMSLDSGLGFFTLEGQNYLAAWNKLDTVDMWVVAATEVLAFEAKVDSVRSELLFITLLGAIAGALILSLLIFIITKPLLGRLSQAMQAAENIADGDLSKPIAISGHDEGTRLLSALSEMQSSLRQSVTRIAYTSNRLSSSAATINQVTKEADDGLQHQNTALETAVHLMAEMKASFDIVSANARKASDASIVGNDQAQVGRDNVNQSILTMEMLTEDLKKSSDNIAALAGQVAQITSVLDVIRAIAEQTNLLALNAAIEAARAGESGRGFAVVADEVRTLAHRTEVSTQEISEIIESIRGGSELAVQSMTATNEKAKALAAITYKSGEALEVITESMTEISHGNTGVARSTEQQAVTISDIDKSLISVKQIADQNAHGSIKSKEVSAELTTYAEELFDVMEGFKV